ncbi:MAG: SoxR reducing system RseC family protein [Methylobacter sp.]
MIEEFAVVTRVASGQVWIAGRQNSACGGCMQQAECGTATLAKLLPKREFAVACELPLQTGDQVRVAIDDSSLLLVSLLVYGLPLAVMLLAVACVQFFLPSLVDWLPEISLSGLLLAFGFIHYFQQHWLVETGYRPVIIGKC